MTLHRKNYQHNGYAVLLSTIYNPPGPLQCVLETKSNKFGRLFNQTSPPSPSSMHLSSISTLPRELKNASARVCYFSHNTSQKKY